MDEIMDSPSNGEEVTPDATETTSPTDGTIAGKDMEEGVWIAHDDREPRQWGDPVPGYHDDDYKIRAYEGIDRPRPKNHTDVKLLSVFEVQAQLRLTYRGTLAWIRTNVTPLGGTVRVGRRVLVHTWALNDALMTKRWRPSRHKKDGTLSSSPSRYTTKGTSRAKSPGTSTKK